MKKFRRIWTLIIMVSCDHISQKPVAYIVVSTGHNYYFFIIPGSNEETFKTPVKQPAVNTPSTGPAPASFLSNTPNESEKDKKPTQIKLKKNNPPNREVHEAQDQAQGPSIQSSSGSTVQEVLKTPTTAGGEGKDDGDGDGEEEGGRKKDLPGDKVIIDDKEKEQGEDIEEEEEDRDDQVQESVDIPLQDLSIAENLGKLRIYSILVKPI